MSRTPSPRELAAGTAIATTLVIAGAVIAFQPDAVLTFLPALESWLLALDPGLVLGILMLALIVLAVVMELFGRVRATPPDPLVPEDQSSDAGSKRHRAPGWSFERKLVVTREYERSSVEQRDRARENATESLRSTAVAALVHSRGIDSEAATALVESGAWTDDPRAKALLATDPAASQPLWLWTYDLLWGDPFERRLEHAIDEIERLYGAELRSNRTDGAVGNGASATRGEGS